jgi:hypothetical protein
MKRTKVCQYSATVTGCRNHNASASGPGAVLVVRAARPHAFEMFVVSDEETAASRDAFEQRGELAAAVEFTPVVSWHYRQCEGARTIAGWKP